MDPQERQDIEDWLYTFEKRNPSSPEQLSHTRKPDPSPAVVDEDGVSPPIIIGGTPRHDRPRSLVFGQLQASGDHVERNPAELETHPQQSIVSEMTEIDMLGPSLLNSMAGATEGIGSRTVRDLGPREQPEAIEPGSAERRMEPVSGGYFDLLQGPGPTNTLDTGSKDGNQRSAETEPGVSPGTEGGEPMSRHWSANSRIYENALMLQALVNSTPYQIPSFDARHNRQPPAYQPGNLARDMEHSRQSSSEQPFNLALQEQEQIGLFSTRANIWTTSPSQRHLHRSVLSSIVSSIPRDDQTQRPLIRSARSSLSGSTLWSHSTPTLFRAQQVSTFDEVPPEGIERQGEQSIISVPQSPSCEPRHIRQSGDQSQCELEPQLQSQLATAPSYPTRNWRDQGSPHSQFPERYNPLEEQIQSSPLQQRQSARNSIGQSHSPRSKQIQDASEQSRDEYHQPENPGDYLQFFLARLPEYHLQTENLFKPGKVFDFGPPTPPPSPPATPPSSPSPVRRSALETDCSLKSSVIRHAVAIMSENQDQPKSQDHGAANSLYSQNASMDPFVTPSTPLNGPAGVGHTAQPNPYAQDAHGLAGSAYFQTQNAFHQPLQYHLYAPIGPHSQTTQGYQRNVHDLFIPNDLREDLQKKSAATLQTLPNSQLPLQVDHFHSLVPLDASNQKSAAVFGYPSWVYKAQSSKDGNFYVLRRLEGYRLTNEKAIRSVQAWKRIANGSIVTIHDAFTNRSFQDSSLIFVMDYHPLSKTLAEQYLSAGSRFQPRPSGTNTRVSEQVLWAYISQIASALKTIHSSGLAARVIDASKILVTGKNRIRLNACAILDVVQFDMQPPVPELQRQDFVNFGQLLLSLASQTPVAMLQNTNKALEQLGTAYSPQLKSSIHWLLTAAQKEQERSIDAFISGISGQLISSFDAALHVDDKLTSELNRELENSRLVRLLCKINFITERPEYEHDIQWSESGTRYFIKLFRDYVFHQVDAQNNPVVDMAHVLLHMNRLDAGTDEKVMLVSRDEQSCFLVTYKELKQGIEKAFQELMKAPAQRPGVSGQSGRMH